MRTPESRGAVSVISAPVVMQKAEPVSTSTFSYINPIIGAGIDKHFIINFKPLKTQIQSIQKKYSAKTYVYFMYLNNAAWVGINERDDFTAASTIKVPIAMAIMKAVEDKKLKLSDSYPLAELDLDKGFGDLYKVGADQEFTVEELMSIMLKQSDNTAMKAIIEVFDRVGIVDPLANVYEFLGWDFVQKLPEFGELPDYSKINLKTLSNLFLALYDAKYISVKDSSKILEYLTDTPFVDRIVAGVPSGVMVSHKIGTASSDNTFSDCGIVYVPNRHYILCLGSGGVNEKTAGNFMAEVSKAVYEYVIKN
jgi:beta-lactamase class A